MDQVEGPSVWQGKELLERDDWLHAFSELEIAEIDAALEVVTARGLATEAITAKDFPLSTLGGVLAGIQNSLENGSGAAMLRGLPMERYSEEEARRLFWGIARHIGTPVSQSAAGDRIFSVRDEGYGEKDTRTRGPNTRKKLSFHTDRCDVIAFLCLKQAKSGGENDLVSSVALYNEILARRPDLVEVLMQPYLYQRHNVDQGNERGYCEQPVFSFQEGHFAANFLRVLIERAYAMPETPDMTPLQREALDFLEERAEALHVRFRQEPGDILLLNNWITFHRRLEFVDHEDLARRRHLLRIWLSVPNSRPLDPAFAANYGAVEASAIRGGMRKSGGT